MTKCTPADATVLLTATFIPADEKLAGIACRSVHLAYSAPEGTTDGSAGAN